MMTHNREIPEKTMFSPMDIAFTLSAGEPLFLVGGQAVNVWALHYRERTLELAPFVSRDVDVLGDRKTLLKIADAVNAKPHFFSVRPPTNEVGVVIVERSDAPPVSIEVLRHVHGIDNESLCRPAYLIMVGDSRVGVRVPSPVALLQAKLANLADLNQKYRQDGRHVRILCKLLPAFFKDIESAIQSGRIKERDMLKLLERLLKSTTAKDAQGILAGIGIRPQELFGEITCDATTLPKVRSFLTERLPRALTNA